jgi:hypothetical protein
MEKEMVRRWYPETLRARNGADLKAAYVLASDYDKLLQENYQLRHDLRRSMANHAADINGKPASAENVSAAHPSLAPDAVTGFPTSGGADGG